MPTKSLVISTLPGAGFALDHVQRAAERCAPSPRLGFPEGARSRMRNNGELESGKISVPMRGSQDVDQSHGRDQIDRDQRASAIAARNRDSANKPTAAVEKPLFVLRRDGFPQEPGGKHRNQAAGQQVGSDHRERHRQRERNEQLPAHTNHEERRHEYRENAQHRQAAARSRSGCEASSTARARETPGTIWVWMFSIDTVASSTRTPTASARPPSVMMLMVWPVAHSRTTAAQQRERDIHHHDQGAAPVAQEDQHHQSGEQCAEKSFDHQVANRIGHVRRLVELQAHVDVLRNSVLELRNRGLDGIDHRQGGGIRALGDRECTRSSFR